MTGNERSPWMRMTARSVRGSRPTMTASAVVPSLSNTWIDPRVAADAITWLLVRMSPLALMNSPEPVPPPDPLRTAMVTTDGNTLCATVVAEHASEELAPPASVAATITPPITPPTTSATAAATAGHTHRRETGDPL